jgi:hypothetical protein
LGLRHRANLASLEKSKDAVDRGIGFPGAAVFVLAGFAAAPK